MNKKFTTVVAISVSIYLLLPVLAGVFAIGNRWGPKVYYLELHQILYTVGWEIGSHQGSKPRVGYWWKKVNRPVFYGLHSDNDRVLSKEEFFEMIKK